MSNQLKNFLSQHPTLLLTFCYFIITIIGVLYSYFFYQEFNINIIKFTDLSDFLFASILEPLSIMVFIGSVTLLFLGRSLDLMLKAKFKGYEKFESVFTFKYLDPLTIIIGTVVLTVYTISILAKSNADNIKNGTYDKYEVHFSESDQSQTKSLALLGASNRYNYFFNVKNSAVLIIPVENISVMRKLVTEKVIGSETIRKNHKS